MSPTPKSLAPSLKSVCLPMFACIHCLQGAIGPVIRDRDTYMAKALAGAVTGLLFGVHGQGAMGQVDWLFMGCIASVGRWLQGVRGLLSQVSCLGCKLLEAPCGM